VDLSVSFANVIGIISRFLLRMCRRQPDARDLSLCAGPLSSLSHSTVGM